MFIGSLEFHEYIGRNLKRHGLGFIPAPFSKSSTDRYTHIKAPVPKDNRELLAYFHELGHCKAKQKLSTSNMCFMWQTTNQRTIYNEVMAWDWALRYAKRLNIHLDKPQLDSILKETLGTYISCCEEIDESNTILSKFYNKFGLSHNLVKQQVRRSAFFNLEDNLYKSFSKRFDELKPLHGDWDVITYSDVKEPKNKKSDKWKPWHDLQEVSAKKYHKNKHRA